MGFKTPTIVELANIFIQLDEDGLGWINPDEFQRFMKLDQGTGVYNEKASMEVYRMFDNDGSGSIEFREVLEVLFTLSNTNKDLSAIPTLFFKIFSAGWDEDGDGKMQPGEFNHFMDFIGVNNDTLDGQEVNSLKALQQIIFKGKQEVSAGRFHCHMESAGDNGKAIVKKILQRMLGIILPEIETKESLSMFRSGLAKPSNEPTGKVSG